MKTRNTVSGVSSAIIKTMTSYENKIALLERQAKSEFSIKIANSLEERKETFHLAYQVYLGKEYVKLNPDEWLVNEYDQNESTTIFIVKDKSGKIIATATLVFSDDSILPAEHIYKNEIQEIKKSGSNIVEVSRLVIDQDYRNSKEILVLLFNYMFIYGYHVKRFDSTIIQVNPRHKDFYKKLLNFREVGEKKSCPIVQNAPAILLFLPLSFYYSEVMHQSSTLQESKKDRSLYPHFINTSQESLVIHYLRKMAKPISIEEKTYFGFSESGSCRAVCVN